MVLIGNLKDQSCAGCDAGLLKVKSTFSQLLNFFLFSIECTPNQFIIFSIKKETLLLSSEHFLKVSNYFEILNQ